MELTSVDPKLIIWTVINIVVIILIVWLVVGFIKRKKVI